MSAKEARMKAEDHQGEDDDHDSSSHGEADVATITSHNKTSKLGKKNKRFSNIAKTYRKIKASAKKASIKKNTVSSRRKSTKSTIPDSTNVMGIQNIIHPDEIEPGVTGSPNLNEAEESRTLSRAQSRKALQHLSQLLAIPTSDLAASLPSPKIYAHQPARMPEHPVLAKLDLVMYNWQNQGAEGTIDRVGLELACAWVLAQETKEDASLPSEIEQRLIAALDKLAYE